MVVRIEVVRMSSGGPEFTRIHLTRKGTEELTLESSAFTVTVEASGTTITSRDRTALIGARTTGHGPGEFRFALDGSHSMKANDFRPIPK